MLDNQSQIYNVMSTYKAYLDIIKNVFFIFLISCPLWSQGGIVLPGEGTTFPMRTHFFDPGDIVVYQGQLAIQDKRTPTNYILFELEESELNNYFSFPNSYNNGNTGMHMNAYNIPATFIGNNASIDESGFTIAFWIKWPYTNEERSVKTVNVMSIVGDQISEIGEPEVLLKTGITHDRRVFVNRQVDITDNEELKFWNLKFWNPEHADINTVVDQNSSDNDEYNDWFFVMLIQEKTQIRMHIGMPNGTFDCMYLNYGLENQKLFNISSQRSLTFFGNDEELYIDDISFWEKPLCRDEAFEYYKSISGIADATFPLNSSTQATVVRQDDIRRMTDDAGRSEGCLYRSNETTARTNIVNKWVLEEEKLIDNQDNKESEPIQLMVYPNPTKAEININIPSTHDDLMEMKLIDLSGRKIQEAKKSIREGNNTVNWRWDNESIPNGLYILRIQLNGKTYTKKIAINCGCK